MKQFHQSKSDKKSAADLFSAKGHFGPLSSEAESVNILTCLSGVKFLTPHLKSRALVRPFSLLQTSPSMA